MYNPNDRFSAYYLFEVLLNEVKDKHKIKLEPSVPRLDCIASAGFYKGMLPFLNKKGMLYLLIQSTRDRINAPDSRKAGVCLQGVGSLNFSSVFTLDKEGRSGFGYGEPNGRPQLANGKVNPIYPYRNDGFLFIFNEDLTRLEVLVIEGARFFIPGCCNKLAAGGYDEAIAQLREAARPIYPY